MHHHYSDIRSRIKEDPKWWDEHAVPRYCEFDPSECANIYAEEVVLVEIACQNCGELFKVAFSHSRHEMGWNEDGAPWVREHLPFDVNKLDYGDPPNTEHCDAGPTMSSISMRVVEYWRRIRTPWGWERVPEHEVNLNTQERGA